MCRTLKAALAGPLEALLILDRMLFLGEELGTDTTEHQETTSQSQGMSKHGIADRQNQVRDSRSELICSEESQRPSLFNSRYISEDGDSACQETSVSISAIPLFDPVMSPRNIAIVACRKSNTPH